MFWNNKKGKEKTVDNSIVRRNVSLPLFSSVVKIDCFDVRVKQNKALHLSVGDVGITRNNVLPAISSKHDTVAVDFNGVECGYLPYNVGDCINDLYKGKVQCNVNSVVYGDAPELYINILLPFVYGNRVLPISAALSNNESPDVQVAISKSHIGDYLLINNNAATGGLGVYNLAIDRYIGDIASIVAPKIVKKFGNSPTLHGAITRIFTSYDGKTLSVYVSVLTAEA